MSAENSAPNTAGKRAASNLDGWIIAGVVFFLACGAIAAFLQGRTRTFKVAGDGSKKGKVEGRLLGEADPETANDPKLKAPVLGIETLSSGRENSVETVPMPPGLDAERQKPMLTDPKNPKSFDPITLQPVKPAVNPDGTPVKPLPTPPTKLGDVTYQYLTFDTLGGFLYDIPDPDAPKPPDVIGAEKNKDQIPAEIHALNGRKVVLQGYMVPFKVDAEGNVRKFLLVRNQNWCCYGVVPRMNEWVSVTLINGLKTEVVQDVPFTVYGTLKVGEEVKDNYVVSVYRLDGERVDRDKGF